MKKISFYKGALTKNVFLGDAFKLEKVGPFFFNFQSMSILAISSNRPCLNIVLHNKTGPLFLNLIDVK